MTFLSTKTKVGLILAAALLLLTVSLASARARSGGDDDAAVDAGGAVELAQPMPRPSFTLTTTEGAPYDFGSQTAGKTALLYFGFLNCPDICPVHLSNIASALDKLTPAQRERVVTVFVTVDPGRDTADGIRRFLDRFDDGFVGLTGTAEELAQAQRAAGVPVAVIGQPDDNGDYEVGHAAQVIAYGPEGPAQRVYPSGATSSDWERDLPQIVEGELS